MSTRRTASSQKKGTVARRKTSSRRGGSGGRRRSSSVFQRYPRLAWWMGGTAVVVLYVFLFYHFFVGPTGFRWRALYGDEVYPEGYEIHGIDISHYQGKIDWLANRRITSWSRCILRMAIFRPYSISSISPMTRVLRIFSVMCSRGCIS